MNTREEREEIQWQVYVLAGRNLIEQLVDDVNEIPEDEWNDHHFVYKVSPGAMLREIYEGPNTDDMIILEPIVSYDEAHWEQEAEELFGGDYLFELIVGRFPQSLADDGDADWESKRYLEVAVVDRRAMYKCDVWLLSATIDVIFDQLYNPKELWKKVSHSLETCYTQLSQDENI